MADAFAPSAKMKFTFGLWTVGNVGRDPFGGPTRETISPPQICDLLGEVGAYGVNFHDDDVIPFGSDEATREHLQGDMRTLRLGRQFDAVFVHDAIEYMTTEDELRQAVATVYAHCRPGGVAVLVPDHIAVWGLLTGLVLAHMPVGQPSLRQAAALSARAALMGLPVMALFTLAVFSW